MTGCNILLQTGGKLLLQTGGALLLTDCTPQPDLDIIHGPNDKWHRDWRVDWKNEQYRKLKERERLKQDKIIELKIEAQEATVAKKEAEALPKSKQRDRQIKAAQNQIVALQEIIAEENAKLAIIERQLMLYKHNVAMVAIIAATPFWVGRA